MARALEPCSRQLRDDLLLYRLVGVPMVTAESAATPLGRMLKQANDPIRSRSSKSPLSLSDADGCVGAALPGRPSQAVRRTVRWRRATIRRRPST